MTTHPISSFNKMSSTVNANSPGSSTDHGKNGVNLATRVAACETTFRPTVLQQAVRAFLHMTAFAVAYLIMLYACCFKYTDFQRANLAPRLAMYYNGYVIICIFVGAFIGFFIFGWESVTMG